MKVLILLEHHVFHYEKGHKAIPDGVMVDVNNMTELRKEWTRIERNYSNPNWVGYITEDGKPLEL